MERMDASGAAMVTKSKALALTRIGAVASPKRVSTPASAGLAIISAVLDDELVHGIKDADQFYYETPQLDAVNLMWVNESNVTLFDDAKRLHSRLLHRFARANEVELVLSGVLSPRYPLTQSEATIMLSYLFAAMGKRRDAAAMAK